MLILALLLAACDQDASPAWDATDTIPDTSPDTTSDATHDTTPDTTPEAAPDPTDPADPCADLHPGPPSFGSDSDLSSVTAMLEWMNEQRRGYEPHDRYRGLPDFSGRGLGEYHTTVTWPIEMEWDECAAAIAQIEADAVASSSTPTGWEVECGGLWIEGVSTEQYMLTSKEGFMHAVNPFMRQAAYYHDPGGEGPVLTKLGAGAADAGDGTTWWVVVWR